MCSIAVLCLRVVQFFDEPARGIGGRVLEKGGGACLKSCVLNETLIRFSKILPHNSLDCVSATMSF